MLSRTITVHLPTPRELSGSRAGIAAARARLQDTYPAGMMRYRPVDGHDGCPVTDTLSTCMTCKTCMCFPIIQFHSTRLRVAERHTVHTGHAREAEEGVLPSLAVNEVEKPTATNDPTPRRPISIPRKLWTPPSNNVQATLRLY
jgi:hypothetical protein